MDKKNIISFICGAIIFSTVTAFADDVLHVEKNKYPIYVEGVEQNIDAYNINDYTYLKLSDFKKILPIDIKFDTKTESINITSKKYTDDDLEIRYIQGQPYVNVFDIQDKYNCLVVGSSRGHKLKIYRDKNIPSWDLDVMRPLLDVDTYVEEGNKWYIDLNLYKNSLLPMLNFPVANNSSYTKDNFNIYIDSGTEYILPNEIMKLYFGEQYKFTCDVNNLFSIVKFEYIDGNYDPSKSKVIASGIPSKAVYGHLCIEYKYFIENILPRIKK